MSHHDRRAVEIAGEVASLPLTQQSERLIELCCGDASLLEEAQALLGELSTCGTRPPDGTPLDHSASAPHATGEPSEPSTSRSPNLVGEYQILRKIGHGGMGEVYEAEQRKPRRTVALKLIHPHLVNRKSIARFEFEADVLGRLQHPAIATIYDAGTDERNGEIRPYFAMELVRGPRLDEWARQRNVDQRRRVELLIRLCDGVQHAHQHGIIHRDLKPANILVSDRDQPKILDFGVAHATRTDVSALTLRTENNQLVGTMRYMSPEQVSGNVDASDTRSDVYALGIIGYELLSGQHPWPAAESSLTEMVDQMMRGKPRPLGAINKSLRGDIETVIAKAMSREKEQRYANAADVGADLRRHLKHEPILARPSSSWYRFRKFARRNKLLVSLIIALMAGIVSSTLLARRALHHQLQAEWQEARAEEQKRAAEMRQYRPQLEDAKRALQEHRLDDVVDALRAAPSSQIGWETHRLRHEVAVRPYVAARMSEHSSAILDVIASSDGKTFISCGRDGQVLEWDGQTQRLRRELSKGCWNAGERLYEPFRAYGLPTPSLVEYFVGLSWTMPDKRFVAGAMSGLAIEFDLETGSQRVLLRANEPLHAVACATGGSHILFGGAAGGLYLQSSADRETSHISRASASAVSAIAWWEGGQKWVVGRGNGDVEILDARTLAVKRRIRVPAPVWGLDVRGATPNGAMGLLAVASQQTHVDLFDLSESSTDHAVRSLQFPAGEWLPQAIHAVRFDENGHLYAADDRQRLARWDVQTGALKWVVNDVRITLRPEPLPLPFRRVTSVIRTCPTLENRLITAGEDMVVKVWDTSIDAGVTEFAAAATPRIAFDPLREELMWILGANGDLTLRDVRASKSVATVTAHQLGATGLAAQDQASRVATCGSDKVVRLWTWTGTEIREDRSIAHTAPLLSVAISHHGKWVAAVDVHSTVVVWDVKTSGKLLEVTMAEGTPLTGRVAFNRDDTRLAAFGHGQTCCVFSTSPFSPVPEAKGPVAGTAGTAMLWHPENRDFLFVADDFPRYSSIALGDCTLQALDIGIPNPRTRCVALTSGPDGRWFGVDSTGRVVVCDPRGLGRTLEFVTLGSKEACDISIDRKGEVLAVGCTDGSIQMWSTKSANNDAAAVPQTKVDWTESILADGMFEFASDANRCVDLDQNGRVCVLGVRKARAGPQPGYGELIYLTDSDTGARVESVADRVPFGSLVYCLLVAPDAPPTAIFKQQDQTRDAYAGTVHVATRSKNGTWQTEAEAIAEGNCGISVNCFARNGRVDEVWHFDYDGCYWLRSSRDDANGWTTDRVGRQGDGLDAIGRRDLHGDIHFTVCANRFNGDAGPPLYVHWDGQQLVREVIDPTALRALSTIALSGDVPQAIVTRRTSNGDLRLYLATRVNGQWKTERLPAEFGPASSAIADVRGRLFFIARSESSQRYVLWWSSSGAWHQTDLPEPASAKTYWTAIRIDSVGRPIVVAAARSPRGASVHVFKATSPIPYP